jgi:hypothetical protein
MCSNAIGHRYHKTRPRSLPFRWGLGRGIKARLTKQYSSSRTQSSMLVSASPLWPSRLQLSPDVAGTLPLSLINSVGFRRKKGNYGQLLKPVWRCLGRSSQDGWLAVQLCLRFRIAKSDILKRNKTVLQGHSLRGNMLQNSLCCIRFSM